MPEQAPLELKPAFHKATGLKLGRRIYSGDGEIYKIRDHDDKLVKVCHTWKQEPLQKMKLFQYLKRSRNRAVVKLYQVGILKIIKAPYAAPEENTYCYYYVMEKLSLMPSKMMKEPFRQLVQGIDNGKAVTNAPRSIKTFVERATKLKYYYSDLHAYNVMRAKNGSLKFVDLESFSTTRR